MALPVLCSPSRKAPCTQLPKHPCTNLRSIFFSFIFIHSQRLRLLPFSACSLLTAHRAALLITVIGGGGAGCVQVDALRSCNGG